MNPSPSCPTSRNLLIGDDCPAAGPPSRSESAPQPRTTNTQSYGTHTHLNTFRGSVAGLRQAENSSTSALGSGAARTGVTSARGKHLVSQCPSFHRGHIVSPLSVTPLLRGVSSCSPGVSLMCGTQKALTFHIFDVTWEGVFGDVTSKLKPGPPTTGPACSLQQRVRTKEAETQRVKHCTFHGGFLGGGAGGIPVFYVLANLCSPMNFPFCETQLGFCRLP